MKDLIELIVTDDPAVRDESLDRHVAGLSASEVLDQAEKLEAFRHETENLYERARASLFLHSIYRFHLPRQAGLRGGGEIPYGGYLHLLDRRFEEAIQEFLRVQREQGPSDALASALASAYHRLAFQTLANQVRRSVRSAPGNQWMFRLGHPLDQPLRFRPEMLARGSDRACFPVLREQTPVRMDLTHSAWSDIFFLAMDYPEGARVLNVSIDLGVHGRDAKPRPPVEAYLRAIDEPVIRLASVDLGEMAEITDLETLFDFAKDGLGLLKAALIASGIVPPGVEGSGERLTDLLERVVGPGLGIELVSNVNGIPKGSRLAVSTNLLAGLIAACMRATGQAKSLTGPLEESERRLVASRAILGEWIAGSGGGWQDSGGVWPGIKLIEGQPALPGSPEDGVSAGSLLPRHTILDVSDEVRQKLQDSLVLVHGGMAQNVGPVLEMVTEKYLLRAEAEWTARGETREILDSILRHLQTGDVRAIGEATTRNFFGPLQAIIPWASNLYTEEIIREVQDRFGDRFWGFWMLGGMAGGGMGFIFDPAAKAEGQEALIEIMTRVQTRLSSSLPFAMKPVVYDFAINHQGTVAELLDGNTAPMPPNYYAAVVPRLVQQDTRNLPPARVAELNAFANACRERPELAGMIGLLFDRLLPRATSAEAGQSELMERLRANGFDPVAHETIRASMRAGRIGLAQNRLPDETEIRDVEPGDVLDATGSLPDRFRERGEAALRNGEVAVISLAGGVGSRWTQGAGVVKALHPFAKIAGRHRSFLEVHLAKSRRTGREFGTPVPHVFTTSYLTHAAIEAMLRETAKADDLLQLSPGRAIGLRMVPMVRDLRFSWEETAHQKLDAQAQKMRDSVHAALIEWARASGEGSDYTDNVPSQCLHPVGHWYEVANLLKNGTLRDLLKKRPELSTLMLHNIDTVGANLDPSLLGAHLASGATLSIEVMNRRLEDRGGGLARVNGRVRLVEGLAMPHEETEFRLSYYNSLTTWIAIDPLLALFSLDRASLADEERVNAGIRALAVRMPTYVTLKDVKRRYGAGHEAVFPVAQFEKLWGDMTLLPECVSGFFVVPRLRAQQLKEQAQLDGWLRDGSAAFLESLGDWS